MIIFLPNDTLYSIQLPYIEGCGYNIEPYSPYYFETNPYIDTILTFDTTFFIDTTLEYPDTTIISIDTTISINLRFSFKDPCNKSNWIGIKFDCSCVDQLMLQIVNPDCSCSELQFSHTEKEVSRAGGLWTEYHVYITAEFPKEVLVKKWVMKNPTAEYLLDSLTDVITQKIELKCLNKLVDTTLDFCVLFEVDGYTFTCCDTINISYDCCCEEAKMADVGIRPPDVQPSISAWYNYYDTPEDTLKITIEDILQNELMTLYNDIPNSLSDTIDSDISSLVSGIYNVVFETGNFIQKHPFILGDSSIVLSADITPNPASGLTTLSYILCEMPASTLRIRVLHNVTGYEYISVLHTPSSLQGDLLLDVNSLPVGVYTLVIDESGASYYLPKLLIISKN